MSSDAERATRTLTNFGGNVSFRPKFLYAPATEDEVREILDRHRGEPIRVIGSLHSWSPIAETPGVAIDLRRMQRVEIRRSAAGVEAWVGGGCTIDRLLRILEEDAGVTLPAIGAVTQQTLAGAIATGTHGSGQHSISHTVDALRVVAYDGSRAVVRAIEGGDALRAARCSLGCLGVVVAVRIRCVRRYYVEETVRSYGTLAEALAQRDAHPLQYFILSPFAWRFVAFRRHGVAGRPDPWRRLYAWLRRLQYLVFVDVGFHLAFSIAASRLRSPRVIRALYRVAGPLFLERKRPVVDRSDRALTLNHHFFRHVEMELAIPESSLEAATDVIRFVTEVFGGEDPEPPPGVREALERIDLMQELDDWRGSYAHNYPLSYRLVLADDTFLSQSSGGERYTISWFCYAKDTRAFTDYAAFIARSLARLYDARPHFGKLFPLSMREVERLYPDLSKVRRECEVVDPDGSFQNAFSRITRS